MGPRTGRQALRDPALLLLLGASLAVNVYGISWGLPSVQGWAMDEILPERVRDGMSRHFSGGWHEKYPPLHYYLLAAAYSPVLRANGVAAGQPVPADVHYVLFLLGRGLSAAMATGTLVFVFLCGREVMDRRASLLATALVASMAPFAFYAKLANLDVPYLFWWTLSLLFFVRCLKRRQGADLVLFALTAVLASVTKDQAVALYVLTVPLVLAARWRQGGLRAPSGGGRARRGRGSHGALRGHPQPRLELGRLPVPPGAHHRDPRAGTSRSGAATPAGNSASWSRA